MPSLICILHLSNMPEHLARSFSELSQNLEKFISRTPKILNIIFYPFPLFTCVYSPCKNLERLKKQAKLTLGIVRLCKGLNNRFRDFVVRKVTKKVSVLFNPLHNRTIPSVLNHSLK
jgi:hypothetical protein